ncbi:MAG TPA: pilus assembly protein PilM [Myxococcales bacterium]|nr:pilus assembly protein PilM [Myxococcales bacterium]
MAVRIWGVDLGAHSVKLCSLVSSFRGFGVESIDQAGVAPEIEAAGQPEGAPKPSLLERQKAALASLIGHARPRPEAVIVALPGAAAATHIVTLPAVDNRKLEQTLAFEVEGLIPFDLTDVAYDHQLLGQADGKQQLLVGIARRTALKDLLAGLAEQSLDPRTVTLAPLAELTLFPPGPAAAGEGILDVGHERCSLVLRDQGKLVFARAFDGGGAGLSRAVARDLNLSFEEAERVKEAQGSLLEGADPALVVPLSRALQPIVRELRQTLRLAASRSRAKFERLWLTGGGGKLHGLAELLARDLELDVRPLPLTPPGGTLPHKATPEQALALGLALSGHGRLSRFNLRRGDQSFQGDFAKIRGKLGKVAALAASLLLVIGLKAYAQMYVLGRQEKALDDAVCSTTKIALGKCIRDVNVARSSLAGGAASASTIPKVSALDLLTETSTHLTVEGAKVTEMDIATDQVEIHGEADSFETVDKVVAALKGYRCFQDVQRGRVQRAAGHDGSAPKIEFNLDAHNTCGVKASGS